MNALTMKTISSKQDEKNSAKIMAIRSAAGNPNTHCPLCGGTLAAPYRNVVNGKIDSGCIDASHTGHLVPVSSSLEWHNRPVARNLRAGALATLVRL